MTLATGCVSRQHADAAYAVDTVGILAGTTVLLAGGGGGGAPQENVGNGWGDEAIVGTGVALIVVSAAALVTTAVLRR